MKRLAIAVLGAAALIAACREATVDDSSTQTANATEIDDTEWVLKASRLILDGRDPTPDELATWSKLPKEEALDRMMEDPAFGDVALRFNLYFLGQGELPIQAPTSGPGTTGALAYSPGLARWPQALASAKAVVSGGDFFQLFAARPDFVNVSAAVTPPSPEVQALLQQAIAQVTSINQACDSFRRWYQGWSSSLLRVLPDGLPKTWSNLPTDRYPRGIGCTDPATGIVPVPEHRIAPELMAANMQFVGTAVAAFATGTTTAPRSIAAMGVATTPAELPPLLDPMVGFWRSPASTISSTNLQRKRAAWVLKTYFCDDLTPASLPAAPASDGGTGSDVHASNTACQGCHYRLDPIAGLFREIGSMGSHRDGSIAFDDATGLNGDGFQAYLKHWANDDGSWKVGYFVMGPDSKPKRDRAWKDTFPTDVEGLWSFLPKSNVAQACVVRRMSEFVLGQDTLVDRDWLAEISGDFTAGPQSSAGFKGVLKKLVMSKTFRAIDPVRGECYDLPTGASPNRPPCEIAQIVSNTCAGCHSSPAGPGHLDFTSWNGTWWSHTDANGTPLAVEESRRRMLDRITTDDLSKRMPLLHAFPPSDFATFKDWLSQ